MRLGIVDSDFMCYISCHNKKQEDGSIIEKSLEQVYQDIDSYINTLFLDLNLTHYLGCLTIGKGFRYKIYPEYKANRKDKIPMPFLKEAKQYMIDKWKFTYHNELEADDLCNIYYFYYQEVDEIYRMSTDKDILNLSGSNYDCKNKKVINISCEQAEKYLWTSMITGDNVDNIKGIPGKGIKYSEKLFNIKTRYEATTLIEYVNYFGEYKGIEEFYKNYKCLYILDRYEGLEIPEPIEFKL